MFNLLCVVLVAAGPWLGPEWPEVLSPQTGDQTARILAPVQSEIHVVAVPRVHDDRVLDGAVSIAPRAVVAPPAQTSRRAVVHVARPDPARVLLITAHASSFL